MPGGVAAVLFAVGAAAVAWAGVRRRALRRGEIPWTSLALTAAVLADVVQAVEWSTAAPAGASLADVLRLAAYGLLATMSLRGTVGGRRRHGALLQASLDGCAALAVALLVVLHSDAGPMLAARGYGLPHPGLWLRLPGPGGGPLRGRARGGGVR